MPYLKHESGEATELRNSQILGDDSPLEFDEDGLAFVEDPVVADKLLAMHRHIERGGRGPEDSGDSSDSGTLPFNPEEHTIDEIEDRVTEIDDVETLRALRNLEDDQKNRDGAKDAINSRLDDLEE